MVKIKFAAFAVTLVAAFALTASAQQPASPAGVTSLLPDGKIAVINTQAFPEQISELRQKYEQVNNQFKDRYERLKALDTQLKQMETDIQTKGSAMAPDKLRELQDNFQTQKTRGSRDYEDLRADVNKAIGTTTKPVWDKISQFMNNYASQRNIVLILDLPGAAQAGSLAYVSPGSDVTADFIAEYNKANPVAGAPAATKPNPQPPATQTPVKPAAKPNN
ncbi:MAG TPA: OmpH family outer membrane protein [Blastocatellia bacterium]|nr:OmpH family outer membrane protein [Blastocatellia bacterium]